MVCQTFDFAGKPSSRQLMKQTETIIYKFVCALNHERDSGIKQLLVFICGPGEEICGDRDESRRAM